MSMSLPFAGGVRIVDEPEGVVGESPRVAVNPLLMNDELECDFDAGKFIADACFKIGQVDHLFRRKRG